MVVNGFLDNERHLNKDRQFDQTQRKVTRRKIPDDRCLTARIAEGFRHHRTPQDSIARNFLFRNLTSSDTVDGTRHCLWNGTILRQRTAQADGP
jgi:hypothetical protein